MDNTNQYKDRRYGFLMNLIANVSILIEVTP